MGLLEERSAGLETQTRLGQRPDVSAWIAQVVGELESRKQPKNGLAVRVSSRNRGVGMRAPIAAATHLQKG